MRAPIRSSDALVFPVFSTVNHADISALLFGISSRSAPLHKRSIPSVYKGSPYQDSLAVAAQPTSSNCTLRNNDRNICIWQGFTDYVED